MAAQPDRHAIAHAAISALHGLHPDPDGALQDFEDHFGSGSTDGLRASVFGGPGAGDRPDTGAATTAPDEAQTEGYIDDDSGGTTDEIRADGPRGPASIALSGGEYIMPAYAVSFLGDGNSAAGSKLLDGLVAKIRQLMKATSLPQSPDTGASTLQDFMQSIGITDGGGEEMEG